MDPETPQATALLTVSGVTVVALIVTEVIKRAAALSDDAVKRWGPLISITIGLVAAALTYIALVIDGTMAGGGAAVVQVILTGLLGGAAAGGVYNSVKSTGGQ